MPLGTTSSLEGLRRGLRRPASGAEGPQVGPDVIVLDFQMPEMNGFDGFAILLGGEINFILGDLRDHRTLQSSTPLRTQSRI